MSITLARVTNLKERLLVWVSGVLGRLLFRANAPLIVIRKRYERLAAVSREKLKAKFPQLAFGDHDLAGVYAESTRAVDHPERILMHLHGGIYFLGSPASFRARAKNLSYRCRATVFLPDYRLAPEHPFPAAFEDAKAAWLALVEQHPDVPLHLSGDSCGGGLALALMMALRDEALPLPEKCFVISPWTDLAATGPSVEENRHRDWFTKEHNDKWTPQILAGADPADPRISPLYGDFAGLPPLLFIVGEHEAILDDTRRCVKKARGVGVTVTELIGARMFHDYPLALPRLRESQRAWNAIEDFLRISPTA